LQKIQHVAKCGKIHQHSTLYLSKQQSTQTGCYTIAACFPFEPLEKCTTFKDIFPGPQASISRNFQNQSNFPGLSRSWNYQEKKSRTFQEAWEPW